MALSYVLPIRRDGPPVGAALSELAGYLRDVSTWCDDVLVVDGSPDGVFAIHDRALEHEIRHVKPQRAGATGKQDGVTTGLHLARNACVVIADDDVRYDQESLRRMATLLEAWDLVRPQNYFSPAPWHALWDSARSLLNRVLGGDWPGTLGVRRELVLGAGAYPDPVMFENLELARVVQAAGGRALAPLDFYVRRLPPTARQFFDQRVRQAYDELARPMRLLVQLCIVPLLLVASSTGSTPLVAAGAALAIGVAEIGRRRAGGARHFPFAASLFAPLWLLERGVCVWIAVASHVVLGGVRYRGATVPRAAHSVRQIRGRLQQTA